MMIKNSIPDWLLRTASYVTGNDLENWAPRVAGTSSRTMFIFMKHHIRHVMGYTTGSGTLPKTLENGQSAYEIEAIAMSPGRPRWSLRTFQGQLNVSEDAIKLYLRLSSDGDSGTFNLDCCDYDVSMAVRRNGYPDVRRTNFPTGGIALEEMKVIRPAVLRT